ncbi:MAG: GGDEF domain-containing protein [Bacillota bacterium]|nr:GGDEF domain-containing protein [Bacillota bacterium]
MDTVFQNKLNEIEEKVNSNKSADAEKLAKELYTEAVNKNEKAAIGYASKYVGQLAFNKGLFQESFESYQRSYANFKEINDSKGQIYALTGLSLLFTETGDFRNALKYMLEVLNIINSERAFEIHRFSTINNIAILFTSLKEYDSALKYLNECFLLSKENNDIKLNAIILFNMAEVYCYKENYADSKSYLEQSRKESAAVEDKVGLSFCRSLDAALIVLSEKNLKEAQDIFQNALTDINKYGTKYDVLDVYSIFYRTLYGRKEYSAVKDVLIKALSLAAEVKSYVKQKEIYGMLHNIYKFEEDYKNAYETLLKKQQLNEMSNSLMKDMQVNYLSETYSTASSKLQLEELEFSVNTLKALAVVGNAITSSLDINKIFKILISNLPNILKLNNFGIAIIDNADSKLKYHFYDDKDGITYETFDLDDDSILMNLSIKANQEIVIYDTKDINEYKSKYNEEIARLIYNSNCRSILFCPLIYENQVIGGITAQSRISHTFSYKNLEILRIMASYVSVAVTNQIKTKYLEEISHLDGLTLLYNRHALSEYLEGSTSIYGTKDMPLAAIMIDIDYLKQFNDNYGHVKGDNCIKTVADIILKAVNKCSGKAFRYGGDEFLIIMENTDAERCDKIISRIYSKLEAENLEHLYSKISNRVTITAGAAIINENIFNYKNLYHRADEALYEAKKRGRNTYLIKG